MSFSAFMTLSTGSQASMTVQSNSIPQNTKAGDRPAVLSCANRRLIWLANLINVSMSDFAVGMDALIIEVTRVCHHILNTTPSY